MSLYQYYYIDMLSHKLLNSNLNTLELSLKCSEISCIKIKNCIFMIRKDGSFCDQNFQFVAILHKKFKIFIFIFFSFNSSFFRNIFHCNIPLGREFPPMPDLFSSFNVKKVTMVRKISAMNKKSYFNNFAW